MFGLVSRQDLTAKRRKEQAKKKKKEQDDEEDLDANYYLGLYQENDEFYQKWSGPVLIGPIFPAMLSILVIVAGQLVINGDLGTCGYDLTGYISAQIAMCYLFLLVFTWVYLGDEIRLQISFMGIDQRLLTPFRSMKWIMGFYLAIGGMNFIVTIVGTVFLQLASFCADTAPSLYKFTVFLVCFWWIGFFICGLFSIKLFFGTTLAKMIVEQTREETLEEVEERIFKKQFQQFDPELKHRIARDDFPKLLQVLGIFVPDEEVAQLMDTLDPDKSGFLAYEAVYEWFKEITKEDEETNKKLENVSDDEDSEDEKDDE